MEFYQIGISENRIFLNPKHTHDQYEIIYNLSGKGITMLADGTTHDFDCDTITVVPAKTAHGKISDEGFTDIWLKITESPFKDDKPHFIDDTECKKIKVLMEMCLEWYVRNDPKFTPAINSTLKLIEILLCTMDEQKQYDSDVEAFIQRVTREFANPDFDLKKAVAESGYCSDHFRRKFKSQTGYSPLEYLNKTRLEYSARLLKNSTKAEYSIGEIAYYSGFNDQRYFSRMFKKYFGYSPKEIRK